MSSAPSLRRILYVEDDPDIQTVAEFALSDIGGFEVAVCGRGDEATARASAFAPDLILLDVMMPGMDGPTTLLALRGLPATATTPVIFMTAKGQAHEVRGYKDLGAVDVIVKPFDPITLPETVARIWERNHDA